MASKNNFNINVFARKLLGQIVFCYFLQEKKWLGASKKEKFYKLLINDKKNQKNKINLILLNKIGKAFYAKNFGLKKIKNLNFQTL